MRNYGGVSHHLFGMDGGASIQPNVARNGSLCRPIILVVLLFRIIDCMRVFDIVFVLTEGGPSNGTVLYPFLIYMQGFRYFNVGYAAALSWLLVVFMSILASLLIRMLLKSSARIL